jgi:hypothetical protein
VVAAREAHDISERRACAILGTDRTSVRYRHRRGDDAPLRARLRALAGERRRFGYRRLGLLLKREGLAPNHKKLRRLYAEERLQVRRRGGRKRALGTRAPIALPEGPNQRCSLDFVSDTLTHSTLNRRPQAGAGHTGADCVAGGAEPALFAGLRLRHADGRPPVQGAVRGGRLHPGMLGIGRRHVIIRPARRARPGRHRRQARLPGKRGQRQWHITDQQRGAGLVPGPRCRLALHRARQAAAERFR